MIRRQLDYTLLLVRTTRNLRATQVAHRIRLRAQRWPPARPLAAWVLGLGMRLRRTIPGWPTDFVPMDVELEGAYPSPEENAVGRFSFLNEERALGYPAVWHQPDASRLWQYHLHYFEWAWSFARHRDAKWARAAFARLWLSWRRSVPFGFGDEWSPYVVSLRAWVVCGIYGSLIAGTDIAEDVVASLEAHGRFLRWHIEHDVGGNHLIKNLKALVGLAVFLGDEGLRAVALKHLERQIPLQILPDGGHYERSPSYHCQVLADLDDVARLLGASGGPAVRGLDEALVSMRSWLGSMLMPDGDVPLFNDCVLVGRDRVKRLRPGPGPTSALTVLEASGYVVMRPDDNLHIVADVGDPCPPDLPAHAHADCLSFELSVGEERIVVDSGTSTYEAGAQRAYERSTPAHNTLTIDGLDQTEVWATFRAARLAHATLGRAEHDGATITVIASHDGYRRLPGRPMHRRTWVVSPGSVLITDEVLGRGRHRVDARVHLARAGVGTVRWRGHTGPGEMVTSQDVGRHAVGFGAVRNGVVVSARWQGELPLSMQVELRFDGAGSHGRASALHAKTLKE